MTEILRLSQLGAGYEGHRVCGVLSATLRAGGGVSLVGANGSGKSTVLRTVVGQLAPVAGSVEFDGAAADDRRVDFRRRVASVFDDDAFFPSLTVAEHLVLVATGHDVENAADAVQHELDFFGLRESASALPSRLSSGQRRRLLLAAAFVRPSTLLCLDEPEQRLDAGMRRRLVDRLNARRATGTAIILATHDSDFVAECADTVVVVADEIRYLDPVAGAHVLPTL